MSLTPKPFRTFMALIAVGLVAAGAQALSQLSPLHGATSQFAASPTQAATSSHTQPHARAQKPGTAGSSQSQDGQPSGASAAALTPMVACSGDVTQTLQAAVNSHAHGTVTIGAGKCSLTDKIALRAPVTIVGAGPSATFLVQHADSDIFAVDAPGVTISEVNLDTATYHPGVPPIPGNPVAPVIFSNDVNTSVIDVTAETGTGYGLRIIGPAPCASDQNHGTVIRNLVISNHGSGGYAAVDLSCTDGITVTNLTINPGGFLALYKDRNVVVDTEHFTSANRPCQPAAEITNGDNFMLRNIYGGGKVTNRWGATNVTIVNDVPYSGVGDTAISC